MAAKNKPIKCKAAVMYSPNSSLVIEEVIVEPPDIGEVRVKILATGVCHSDAHFLWGNRNEVGVPHGQPIIIGHEGAGIVEAVGDNVCQVKVGDHVVLLWLPQCGVCSHCRDHNPKANLCSIAINKGQSWLMRDGTSRYRLCRNDKPVLTSWTNCNLATFVEYTVVDQAMVAKINDSIPMDILCLFGCGITTGYGSALNVAKVHKHSSCAVWGLGCVGLATIVGCKQLGASVIIAIDVNHLKLDLATKLGATHVIDANIISVESAIKQILDSGIEYAFDCVGNRSVLSEALNCLSPFGTLISVGLVETSVTIAVSKLLSGQTITGAYFGAFRGRDGAQQMAHKYRTDTEFRNSVNMFVSKRFKLEDINQAFDSMRDKNESIIRSVLIME